MCPSHGNSPHRVTLNSIEQIGTERYPIEEKRGISDFIGKKTP